MDAPPSGSSGPRPWRRVLLAGVLVGIGLRLVQWAAGLSLWLDELYLVDSLLTRTVPELLTGDLAHEQVAPAAFLLLQKGIVALLGGSERALRLVPTAASVGSLLLFARLAPRLVGPRGAAAGVWLFALNPLLVGLGGAVKPYAGDVLATVVLLALFRRWTSEEGPSPWTVAAVAGAVGLWSLPAAVVSLALATAWTLGPPDRPGPGAPPRGPGGDRRPPRWWLSPVAWAAAAAAVALQARANVPAGTRTFMLDYWSRADAFMPSPLDYPTWILEVSLRSLVPGLLTRPYVALPTDGLALDGVVAGAALVAVGAGAVLLGLRRGPAWFLAVCLPGAGALALSHLEAYPLAPRTWAFLLPLLLLCVSAAVEGAAGALARRRRALSGVVPATVLAGAAGVLMLRPPPYPVQDTRGLLAELAALRPDGEPLLAHPHAAPALAYYGSRLGIGGEVRVADRSPDPRSLLLVADRYRGVEALWVLFTWPTPDRDPLVCYLGAIGVETSRVVRPGASMHRFDLSRPDRAARAEASSFPLPAAGAPAPACGVPTANGEGDPPGPSGSARVDAGRPATFPLEP